MHPDPEGRSVLAVDGESVELHRRLEVVIPSAALPVRISSGPPGVSPSSLVRP